MARNPHSHFAEPVRMRRVDPATGLTELPAHLTPEEVAREREVEAAGLRLNSTGEPVGMVLAGLFPPDAVDRWAARDPDAYAAWRAGHPDEYRRVEALRAA